jgi:hypothetical protein
MEKQPAPWNKSLLAVDCPSLVVNPRAFITTWVSKRKGELDEDIFPWA